MKNSFIISYRETSEYRKQNLISVLNYLISFINSETEIVLIEQDNESKVDWLSQVKKSEKINHIFIKNEGIFNKWLGYNIGVKESKGENIIFNDADMFLKPNLYRFSINLLNKVDIVKPYKFINSLDKNNSDLFKFNKCNFDTISKNNSTLSDSIFSGIFLIKKDVYLSVKGLNHKDKLFNDKIEKSELTIRYLDDASVHIYHDKIIIEDVKVEEVKVEEVKVEEIKVEEVKDVKQDNGFKLTRTIPKRMFFYWNNKKLSWMRYMTLYSFKKMNPDWEVVLYVSDNNMKNKGWKSIEKQDYHTYKGKNYFDKLKKLNIKIEKAEFPLEIQDKINKISPIHESDLFRYYQLFKNGGFYCDMDVLFFKPINDFYDKIVNGGYDTIVHGYQSPNKDMWWITIGFLASSINNEYYKNLFELGIDNIENSYDNYQAMGALLIYKLCGVKDFTYAWDKLIFKYPTLKFYNLDTDLIYNYDWTKIDYCFKNSISMNQFNINSIGYHWFGGCNESQKYNNILNETNYNNYKTTFSKISDEIINMELDKNGYVINKEKTPRISIVTSYYNRKSLFYKTLKTISKSQFDNFELIVVDDCSSNEHRLEDLTTEFKFLKIIRLEKENKWYINPCVPFNIGIRAAIGEIIILQNPECLHVHDVLSYVNENVDDGRYVSMSTYALDNSLTETLSKNIDNDLVIQFFNSLPQQSITDNCAIGWFNHSKFRPVHYHFCSAITKKNMDKLNGFDEIYANGIGYDDDDFIERVKQLGLELIINDNISVIHQYHPTVFYNMPNSIKLSTKNKKIFINSKKK